MKLFVPVTVFILIVHYAPTASAETPSVSTGRRTDISATQIRDLVRRCLERIDSILVVYSMQDQDPAGSYLYRKVAVQRPCLLYHETSHGNRVVSWEDYHRRQICRINNDEWSVEWVVNRSFRRARWDAKSELPGSMPDEFFWIATGIWIMESRPPPKYFDTEPLMLNDVAASDAYDTLRPQTEFVDGRECHILERPNIDTLWFDLERGCALMAREMRHPKNGQIVQRFELGGHQMTGEGIWLPSWIRNIQFDYSSRNPNERKRRVIDSKAIVKRIQINDLDEGLFTFAVPEGAIWLNPPDGKPKQITPGGYDHIDQLVAWSKRAAIREPQGFLRGTLPLIYSVSIVFLFVGVGWLMSQFVGRKTSGEG